MLATIGVIIAAFVRTGRIQSVERMPLYVRTPEANDLSPDTRVFLKGLNVGRMRNVIPQINPETQQLTFLIQLDINVAFEDGTQLLLPEGTTVSISRPTPIAPPVIRLVVPDSAVSAQTMLAAGDTINAVKGVQILDVVTDIAGNLTDEIFETMEDVRELIAASIGAITEAETQVATTVPMVDSLLAQISTNLAATGTLIEDLTPRVGVIQDSALAVVSAARTTILGFDSLRGYVQGLAENNNASIEEVIRQMARTSIILGNFADQISRRPARIITGVTPPPEADSTLVQP